MEILQKDVFTFFIVLMRVGLVLAFLPVFGSAQVPGIFKVGIAVGLSVAITPVVIPVIKVENVFEFILKEFILSVVLAMIVRLVFFGIDVAGQLMSTTMGLSMATVFNPEIGQSTELARFYSILGILLFLSLNLHHQIIYALVESFSYIPSGGFSGDRFLEPFISIVGRIFHFAVRVSLPVVVVMMIVNIVLGLLYKVIPQFNLFFVGYPLYIGVGLLIVLLGLTFFMSAVKGAFEQTLGSILGEIIHTGAR